MRLFLGIVIESEDQEVIYKTLQSHTIHSFPMKWVVSDNYHMTLHFIGETNEENLAYWKERLFEIGSHLKPFEITFNVIEIFKKKKQAIIWLGSRVWPTAIIEVMSGLPGMENEKVPHLTIGRGHIKYFEQWESQSIEPIKVSVTRIGLYESISTNEGVLYKKLCVCQLGE